MIRGEPTTKIEGPRFPVSTLPCARFAQFRRAGSGGTLRSVTAELHGSARAHWWRSFAPHRVSFLPRLSVWGEEDEGERKVRVCSEPSALRQERKRARFGQQAIWHALAYGKRAQKRSYSDGRVRCVQTKG